MIPLDDVSTDNGEATVISEVNELPSTTVSASGHMEDTVLGPVLDPSSVPTHELDCQAEDPLIHKMEDPLQNKEALHQEKVQSENSDETIRSGLHDESDELSVPSKLSQETLSGAISTTAPLLEGSPDVNEVEMILKAECPSEETTKSSPIRELVKHEVFSSLKNPKGGPVVGIGEASDSMIQVSNLSQIPALSEPDTCEAESSTANDNDDQQLGSKRKRTISNKFDGSSKGKLFIQNDKVVANYL